MLNSMCVFTLASLDLFASICVKICVWTISFRNLFYKVLLAEEVVCVKL